MSKANNLPEVSVEECNRCYSFLQTPAGEEFLQRCRPVAEKISKLSELKKDPEWQERKQDIFTYYMQNLSSAAILRALNAAGCSFSIQSPRTCDHRLESWGFPLNRYNRRALTLALRHRVASQESLYLDNNHLDGPSSQPDPLRQIASGNFNEFVTEFNSELAHTPLLVGTSITSYNFPDSPTLGATEATSIATNQIEPLEISNPWLPQEFNWSLPLQDARISHLDPTLGVPTPLTGFHAEDQLDLSDPTFNNSLVTNGNLVNSTLAGSGNLVLTNPKFVGKNRRGLASDADSGFYSMSIGECDSFPKQGLVNIAYEGDISYQGSNPDARSSVGGTTHVLNIIGDKQSDRDILAASNFIIPGTLQELRVPEALSNLYRIRCDKDHRDVAQGLGSACDCGVAKIHAICIWATHFPDNEVVRSLESISNKDERDGAGNTPLHYLAAAGRKRLLDYILSFGVNVKCLNSFGQNFLHVLDASTFGDELIEFLGSFRGYDLLDQRDHNGRTALHGLLRCPIDQPVSRELVTFYGPERALHFALRDNQGRNAAHYLGNLAQQQYPCASYDYADYVETVLLYEKIARSFTVEAAALGDATQRGSPNKDQECAAVLNKASSVANSESRSGSNALHCLVIWPSGRSLDIDEFRVNHVKQYISCGVDINSYDHAGRTPLLAFLHESHPEDDESTIRSIVGLLVQNGADVHPRDRDGHSAIYHAVSKGFSGCVSILLKNGARANSRSKDGRSLRRIAQESLQLQLATGDQPGCGGLQKYLAIMKDLLDFSAVLEPTPLQEWGVESMSMGSGSMLLG